MKTVCIYHSRDLDGWMSAAIFKMSFVLNNTKMYTIVDYTGKILPDYIKEDEEDKDDISTLNFFGWTCNHGSTLAFSFRGFPYATHDNTEKMVVFPIPLRPLIIFNPFLFSLNFRGLIIEPKPSANTYLNFIID